MHGLCEKCGAGNGFLTRLAGGVTTVLCPVCTTEWHVHTRDHDSVRKMGWANAVMQNVIQRGTLHATDPDYTYLGAQLLHSEHSNTIFDVALEWLERKQPTQPFEAK